MKTFFCSLAGLLLALSALAQTSAVSNPDSATFDPDGTAHILRVVPMPMTVSPEAQQWLKQIETESPQSKDLAEIRKGTDEWRKRDSAEALRLYPVKV
jgi:monoterpene epsilon-lactone hydrolase